MNAIKKIVVNELHAPARRNFPRRNVIMRGIDETWQADLVDMQKYSTVNKGFHFLLTVIDNVSKYAWGIPLKNKSGSELTKALKALFKKGRIPKNLQVDNGTEFYNKEVKALLRSHKVHLYSSFSEKKASICERFNRTLKTYMWKQFSLRGNYKWVDILPELIHQYNNKIHRSIKMRPNDVNIAQEEKLVKMLNTSNKYPRKKSKFKVGDHVRISKYKGVFEKGYTPNWSVEIFTIDEVQKTKPVTYKIRDYENEILEGCFYEFELLPVKYSDVYLVEKILRRRGKKVYVKWLGFDSTHNSWEDESNL